MSDSFTVYVAVIVATLLGAISSVPIFRLPPVIVNPSFPVIESVTVTLFNTVFPVFVTVIV